MKYFAYGSNMSQERLENRIDIIEKSPDYFILEKYVLKFNKIGKDGSGKCNICYTGNSDDKVYGVLYEISCSNIEKLDNYENVPDHYKRECIEIKNEHGTTHDAVTYVAKENHISKEELNPSLQYKKYVLDGATESELPPKYIEEYLCKNPTTI